MNDTLIFHGQWNPPVDLVLFKNYFSDRRPRFFVDCGASDGLGNSNTYAFEKYLYWGGICIEANPYNFKLLKNNRPDVPCFNYAVSDYDGEAILRTVLSAPGGGGDNSSINHKEGHLKTLINWGCTFEDIRVEARRLETVFNYLGVGEIDLLSLDIEGHEVNALKGLGNFRPKVLCIEYPISGLESLNETLFPLGYKLNFISFNNAFYSFEERETWFGQTERMKAEWE